MNEQDCSTFLRQILLGWWQTVPYLFLTRMGSIGTAATRNNTRELYSVIAELQWSHSFVRGSLQQNEPLIKSFKIPWVSTTKETQCWALETQSQPKAAAAAKSLQLCLTLCDPIDGSPLGSPVPGILQARILEWVAIPFLKGSFWPSNGTQVSCIAGRFFTIWVTREALNLFYKGSNIKECRHCGPYGLCHSYCEIVAGKQP